MMADRSQRNLQLFRLGLHTSSWALTSGGKSNYYWDLDTVLTTPSDIEAVATQYLEEIINVQKELGPINRLAFIEKDSGPVGALSLKDLLIVRSAIPGIILRLQRRILSAAIKAREPLQPGEKIVIISDVATSGAGILKAANIAWAARAKVIAAIVYFDREQGAIENLRKVGIKLSSITRSSVELPHFSELTQKPINISSSSISFIGNGN